MSQTELSMVALDAPNMLQEVAKLRVDAIYGKKKHFNAADRKRRYHFLTGIPALVINLLLGSYFVGVLSSALPNLCNWVGAFLAFIAVIMIAIQTIFNFERRAKQHQNIAARYLSVAKESERLIAYCKDGKVGVDELRKQLECLAKRNDKINADDANCPTSKADYRKAKRGFEEGEEEYKEIELSVGK